MATPGNGWTPPPDASSSMIESGCLSGALVRSSGTSSPRRGAVGLLKFATYTEELEMPVARGAVRSLHAFFIPNCQL